MDSAKDKALMPFEVPFHIWGFLSIKASTRAEHVMLTSENEAWRDVSLFRPQGGRLEGNQGCSVCSMTLISVHFAHYPTSLVRQAGLVCVGVCGVGLGKHGHVLSPCCG